MTWASRAGQPPHRGTDGRTLGRAGGVAFFRARMRRRAAGGRLSGDRDRRAGGPAGAPDRGRARCGLQRAARPLGRGWLRAGPARMAAHIPYTHSGVLASALAMDKQRSKVFRAAGLPVVDSLIAPAEAVQAAHAMPPPYVVKPNNEGSSVGIYIVHEGAERAAPAGAGDAATGDGRGLRAGARTDRHGDGRPRADRDRHRHRRLVRLCRQVHARRVAPCRARRIAGAGVRRLPRHRAARPCGAGLPRAEPGRFPLGRGARPRRAGAARGQHPARHDAHLAEPRTGPHAGIGFAELCRWIVEDASCNR
jgi:D-alanine-D-alanine ligase